MFLKRRIRKWLHKERNPLTRPSSPNPASGYSPNSFSQSSLGVFPFEIRQQIWKDVLGGNTFHLMISTGTPGFISENQDLVIHRNELIRSFRWRPRQSGNGTGKVLSILLTCRQIYSEAIDYLYSTNTLVVLSAYLMANLPLVLLPQRINVIRSLRLTVNESQPPLGPSKASPESYRVKSASRQYNEAVCSQARWTSLWHNISMMKNLRSLQVKFFTPPTFWKNIDARSARVLMEPIRAVTGLEVFILILPFPAMDGKPPDLKYPWWMVDDWPGIDPWDDLPCTIRRVTP